MEECVSIIVPVYNVSAYLARCLDSLVSQTYHSLEIFLVDDGSTDDSYKIAAEYAEKDPRIQVIRQKNAGSSAARNTALERASGQWIMFVDSDDYLELKAVELLHDAVTRHGVKLGVAGHYVCFEGKRKTAHIQPEVLYSTAKLQEYFIRRGRHHNFPWSKLYHRDIFDRLHYPVGKVYEDIRLLPLILEEAGSGVIIDVPLYNYCLRRESVTYQSKIDKQYQGLEACLNSQEFYRSRYPGLLDAASAQTVDYCCYLMGRICRAGRREHADYWKHTIAILRENIRQAYPCGIIYRIVAVLLAISPPMLGKLFQIYSAWKNGVS